MAAMGWEDAVANVAFAGLEPRLIGVDVDPPNHGVANLDAAHRRWIIGSWTQPTPTLLVKVVEDSLPVTGRVEPSYGDDAVRHGKRHTLLPASDVSEIRVTKQEVKKSGGQRDPDRHRVRSGGVTNT
jgi:hypothetical protein